MSKRKSPAEESVQQAQELRRSTRQKTTASADPGAVKGSDGNTKSAEAQVVAQSESARDATSTSQSKSKNKTKSRTGIKKATVKDQTRGTKNAHPLSPAEQSAGGDDRDNEKDGTRRYWLMKAEPESRIEKGKDVKFSIDDLATRTEPEPWDGIRAYPARNNLRSMKKGDYAFFYHSNTKIPAIVGTMEVVQEHSPDMSAQDPEAIYYDAKDTDPSKPKWSVVHVEFREKFKRAITLQELKDLAGKNDGLQGMQMLKQSRLSVSAVSQSEWDYIRKWLKDHDE